MSLLRPPQPAAFSTLSSEANNHHVGLASVCESECQLGSLDTSRGGGWRPSLGVILAHCQGQACSQVPLNLLGPLPTAALWSIVAGFLSLPGLWEIQFTYPSCLLELDYVLTSHWVLE